MAGDRKDSKREGLQPQTLVIAAVASGIAAVLTSHFWKNGTVLAAAMTPVVVSLIKEMLERPMQSEVVRRSASKVSDVATARRAIAGGAAARTERARRSSPALGTIPPPPPANGNGHGNGFGNGNGQPRPEDELTSGDVLLSHPRKTYGGGGSRLRRVHFKVALVTGLLAFLVAAVVLTVPELVFGGAVSSGHRTTFFGGGSKQSQTEKKSDSQKNDNSGGDSGNQQDQSTQTTPGSTQAQPAPDQTQTQPQQTPSQPQPSPSTPPPSSGGSAPPSGGSTPPAPTP